MVLHDSLSRHKRELPPPPGPIRMYVCGPTVYQRIHVGNVRPYVVSSGWSPVEERNHEFLTGERTPEGYFRVEGGIESKIARASATRRTPT